MDREEVLKDLVSRDDEDMVSLGWTRHTSSPTGSHSGRHERYVTGTVPKVKLLVQSRAVFSVSADYGTRQEVF